MPHPCVQHIHACPPPHTHTPEREDINERACDTPRRALTQCTDTGATAGPGAARTQRAAGLFAALAEEAAAFQAAQYAQRSQETIDTAVRAYLAYCQATNDWPSPHTGISDAQMVRYVTFLARTVAYSTILNYLSMGVRIFHLRQGIPYTPPTERYIVDVTLKGIRREKGDKTEHKLPVTLSMLRQMRTHLDLSDRDDATFWAATLIGFFCLLRKGNITCTNKMESAQRDTHILRMEDLQWRDGRIWLRLTHTKTIQYKERELWIPVPLLHSEPTLCPTAALIACLSGQPAAAQDAVFRIRDKGKLIPMPYQYFLAKLKASIKATGTDPAQYAGHSLRRGGATYALSIGIPIPAIMAMGDWKSDAYIKYCEIHEEIRLRAAEAMAEAFYAPNTPPRLARP